METQRKLEKRDGVWDILTESLFYCVSIFFFFLFSFLFALRDEREVRRKRRNK